MNYKILLGMLAFGFMGCQSTNPKNETPQQAALSQAIGSHSGTPVETLVVALPFTKPTPSLLETMKQIQGIHELPANTETVLVQFPAGMKPPCLEKSTLEKSSFNLQGRFAFMKALHPAASADAGFKVEIKLGNKFIDDPNKFEWSEFTTTGAESQIEATLSEGELTFHIETEGAMGRGPVPGKILFQEAMNHFAGRVETISGTWITGTNRDEFEEHLTAKLAALAKPVSLHDVLKDLRALSGNSEKPWKGTGPVSKEVLLQMVEESARETWTGKRAVAYGYSKVTIENIRTNPFDLTGLLTIFVVFSKPKMSMPLRKGMSAGE